MSVADTDNRSGTTSKRVVYNLDAIGNMMVPSLGLGVASFNIGSALQQTASFSTTLEAIFRPIRQMIEAFQEFIKRTIKPLMDIMLALTRPLGFLVSTRPVYYVPAQPVAREVEFDRHLAVRTDDYGYFVINGRQLKILSPNSSRCGKLLALLLKHRSRVVDYQTLRAEVGSGNLDKTFKDLKYQLKQEGIVLDYVRPRSYGIALNGLLELQ